MDRAKAIIFGVIPKDNSHHFKEDGILFAVVGELARLKDAKQRAFFNGLSLQTPEGIAAAQELQGELKGIEICISLIEGLENERSEQRGGTSGDSDTSFGLDAFRIP